jgi:hypothetical protein
MRAWARGGRRRNGQRHWTRRARRARRCAGSSAAGRGVRLRRRRRWGRLARAARRRSHFSRGCRGGGHRERGRRRRQRARHVLERRARAALPSLRDGRWLALRLPRARRPAQHERYEARATRGSDEPRTRITDTRRGLRRRPRGQSASRDWRFATTLPAPQEREAAAALRATQFRATQFRATQFRTTQFRATQFRATQFRATQFREPRPPRGPPFCRWPARGWGPSLSRCSGAGLRNSWRNELPRLSSS